jgi:hypothetical protein
VSNKEREKEKERKGKKRTSYSIFFVGKEEKVNIFPYCSPIQEAHHYREITFLN